MSQAYLFPDFEPLTQASSNGDAVSMFAPDGILTVAEVVREFYTHRKQIYTERSFEERKRVLDRFVAALGPKTVGQCRPIDLDRFILEQTGWKATSTRRTHWNLIQAVFSWAGKVRLIASNPFLGGEAPDAGDPRPAVPDQWLLALLRRTDACFRRFLIFVRVSSLRPGEVADLQWSWVDLRTGIITLARHKTRKRTRKPKVVPLTIPALKLLLWLRRRQPGSDHVFLNVDGNPWTRTNLSNRMQRLRKRAQIPDWVKIHGLRHQAASEAVGAGASLKLVSEGLGHTQTGITERYYVHLGGQHLEEIRKAMEMGAHIKDRSR